MTTRNDHAIKLINALPVCGKDLRRVLLALAGEEQAEAMPPDGTRWVSIIDPAWQFRIRAGKLEWRSEETNGIWEASDPIGNLPVLRDSSQYREIPPTPPAAAPSPAHTELEAAAEELVDVCNRIIADDYVSVGKCQYGDFGKYVARVRAALREVKR